jgi:hypothetical protein
MCAMAVNSFVRSSLLPRTVQKEVIMKTRGAGSMFMSGLIFIVIVGLFAKLAGFDGWIIWAFKDFMQSLRVATGWTPEYFFRNVSVAGEARTYGEVLATNSYLQMYFIAGGICALLSAVFVLRAEAEPLWRYHGAFVAFLLLLLLPVALTTITYSEIFAAHSVSYICLSVLILLGLGATYELMRVRTKGPTSKIAQAFVLLLVSTYGVFAPAYYGVKFMWYA